MNATRIRLITIVLIVGGISSCFKKKVTNEYALMHQRACVESLEMKDAVRAQTHCELCLEYDAAMPECLNGIGLIALMNNDQEKAQNFFTKALRQDPEFSQARNNVGVVIFYRGDFKEALKYFDRALEINPSNVDARYNASLSHFRIGQRSRANGDVKDSVAHLLVAKDQMKKLLAIEPTYPAAFRDLGLIDLNLYDQSEFENQKTALLSSAKASFSRCVEAQREEDTCYEGLGRIFFEEGRFDQSFANYFLCLTHSPRNSDCRTNIAAAYEKSAQVNGGFIHLKKVVGNEPANALAHEALCAALFERGLDKEAVKECQVAVRLKPDLCSAHFRLAEYFSKVLNVDSAISYCQTFLTCGAQTSSNEIKICQNILTTVRR